MQFYRYLKTYLAEIQVSISVGESSARVLIIRNIYPSPLQVMQLLEGLIFLQILKVLFKKSTLGSKINAVSNTGRTCCVL